MTANVADDNIGKKHFVMLRIRSALSSFLMTAHYAVITLWFTSFPSISLGGIVKYFSHKM
jgi:hypothetical protein